MSNEDWKTKLQRGDLDLELSVDVLKTIGIGRSKLVTVFKKLVVENGRETWGSVLALTDFDKVKDATGDLVSADTLWNFIQDQKAKGAAAVVGKGNSAS